VFSSHTQPHQHTNSLNSPLTHPPIRTLSLITPLTNLSSLTHFASPHTHSCGMEKRNPPKHDQPAVESSPGQVVFVEQESKSNSKSKKSKVGALDDSSAGESDSGKLGLLGAFINMLNSFFGSGVLGLPYAFRQAGMYAGTVTILVVALLSNYSMKLLVSCREIATRMHPIQCARGSYSDVGFAAYGPLGRRLVNWSIIVTQLGFCSIYMIFLGKAAEMRWIEGRPVCLNSRTLETLVTVACGFSLSRTLELSNS
jgi:Transmembrane amino acid transporter protein